MIFDNVFACTEQLTSNFLIDSAIMKWCIKFLIDYQCFSNNLYNIISTLSHMLRFLTYETDLLDEMMRVFDVKKEELFWCEVWLNYVWDFDVKIEFWNFNDVILLRKIDLAFVQIIRSLFKVMIIIIIIINLV